jgi:hypothetical protein
LRPGALNDDPTSIDGLDGYDGALQKLKYCASALGVSAVDSHQ